MKSINKPKFELVIPVGILTKLASMVDQHLLKFIIFSASIISVFTFIHYSESGMNLAYNDARSHLDIGRRVVEGLKPGLAQLGSVWLPILGYCPCLNSL
jgi:hypothetical protein